MRRIVLFFLFIIPFLAYAQEESTKPQELVIFNLTESGAFTTDEGKDFVVVPFEGKSAHEIYLELAANVSSTYNDPSKVMTGVEDTSIKIRGFMSNIATKQVLTIRYSAGAYYQLEFRIKDGRVRVSAPRVEPSMTGRNVLGGGQTMSMSFPDCVKKWFKNGKVKDGDRKKVNKVQNAVNGPINSILGLLTNSSNEEEW